MGTGKPGRPARDATLESAARATIGHAARIRDDPQACPTFPGINRPNGAAETLCHMQGYLAGRMEAAGKMPTREQMMAIRDDVMHDDAVREIVVGMQDSTLLRPGDPPPQREY